MKQTLTFIFGLLLSHAVMSQNLVLNGDFNQGSSNWEPSMNVYVDDWANPGDPAVTISSSMNIWQWIPNIHIGDSLKISVNSYNQLTSSVRIGCSWSNGIDFVDVGFIDTPGSDFWSNSTGPAFEVTALPAVYVGYDQFAVRIHSLNGTAAVVVDDVVVQRTYENTSSAIETIQINEMNIGRFTAKTPNFILFDMNGRIIETRSEFNGQSINIDFSNLSVGIYFAKTETRSYKFIKI